MAKSSLASFVFWFLLSEANNYTAKARTSNEVESLRCSKRLFIFFFYISMALAGFEKKFDGTRCRSAARDFTCSRFIVSLVMIEIKLRFWCVCWACWKEESLPSESNSAWILKRAFKAFPKLSIFKFQPIKTLNKTRSWTIWHQNCSTLALFLLPLR